MAADNDDTDILLTAAYERQGQIADLQLAVDEADMEGATEAAKVLKRSIRREQRALDALLPGLPENIRPLFSTRGGEKINANHN